MLKLVLIACALAATGAGLPRSVPYVQPPRPGIPYTGFPRYPTNPTYPGTYPTYPTYPNTYPGYNQNYYGNQIPILRQTQDIQPDGSYQYAYQTANGITAEEVGNIRLYGPEQADKTVQGSASWTSPEGELISFNYIADENGYRAQGSHIPQSSDYYQKNLNFLPGFPQRRRLD